ncbi:MAG: hypothetical protein AMXMBFR59_02790 [Rhodanobacteraceae bacterium]
MVPQGHPVRLRTGVARLSGRRKTVLPFPGDSRDRFGNRAAEFVRAADCLPQRSRRDRFADRTPSVALRVNGCKRRRSAAGATAVPRRAFAAHIRG